MLLYNIKRVNTLFDVLDHCKGEVELTTPDGTSFSWRNDGKVLKSFSETLPNPAFEQVELKLTNQEDSTYLFDYLMEAAC